MCESLLEKFLLGEELLWNDEEINQVLKLSIVHSSLKKLKEKGLVDFIQNEEGEEIIFLTENGRETAQKLL